MLPLHIMHIRKLYRTVTAFILLKIYQILSKNTYISCFHPDYQCRLIKLIRKCRHFIIHEIMRKELFCTQKWKEGYTINDIVLLLHAGVTTVKKYMKDDCPLINGGYDNRRSGKLVPYEQEVIEMRAKGNTYQKIHKHICEKGYTGTVVSIRVFMQEERIYQGKLSEKEGEPVEYIPRRFLCQLIYRELEEIKGLTQ